MYMGERDYQDFLKWRSGGRGVFSSFSYNS